MSQLTPTGYTILGYLASHPRSGYDIGRAASRTVFWGVSEGQLYPQLRLLADQGLIEPDGTDTGDDVRGKHVWRIREAGRDVLRNWLQQESAPVAIRDENLVKIMFASRTDHDLARALVEERRQQFTALRDTLRDLKPGESWTEEERRTAANIPVLIRDYGLAYCDTGLAWCDTLIAALDPEGAGE